MFSKKNLLVGLIKFLLGTEKWEEQLPVKINHELLFF